MLERNIIRYEYDGITNSVAKVTGANCTKHGTKDTSQKLWVFLEIVPIPSVVPSLRNWDHVDKYNEINANLLLQCYLWSNTCNVKNLFFPYQKSLIWRIKDIDNHKNRTFTKLPYQTNKISQINRDYLRTFFFRSCTCQYNFFCDFSHF